MRFEDRRQAGELLGEALAALSPPDPVVYALPRGGVPVGFGVAQALHCPLDVLVVRKIGVPYQPELAMGAIGEGDVVVWNRDVLSQAAVRPDELDRVMEAERRELDHRVAAFRGGLAPISPEGRTAIVVDDGIATGSSALAAVEVLAAMGAAAIWLAVPVAPAGPLGDLERVTERIVALSRPRGFGSVGSWYRHFDQTGDSEVRALLAESRLA